MSDLRASTREVIERLERATGPDRGLDADISRAIGTEPMRDPMGTDADWLERLPSYPDSWIKLKFYTASIDAALTLVSHENPWTLTYHENGLFYAEAGDEWQCSAPTAAIALCIAALKAHLAISAAAGDRAAGPHEQGEGESDDGEPWEYWRDRAIAAEQTLRQGVSPGEREGWREIESAPLGDDDFYLVCAVGDDRSPFVVRGSIYASARKHPPEHHLSLAYLTHWQPLPAPPSSVEQKSRET